MNKYKVKCVFNKISSKLNISVPGSKSITNRSIFIAALASGKSTLLNPLYSTDTADMISVLSALGIKIETLSNSIIVHGSNGYIAKKEGSFYLGSAGTVARFITALLSFSRGIYELDASPQMKRRPMKGLLEPLSKLGVKFHFKEKEGYFPFVLDSRGIHGGEIDIDTEKSSQFLSAILMSGFLLNEKLAIRISGRSKLPYVELTLAMMRDFGIDLKINNNYCIIDNYTPYNGLAYNVEPDLSSASYFYSMAPLLGCTVKVNSVKANSIQGDLKFIRLLTKLGCTLLEEDDGLVLVPTSTNYSGLSVNLNDCSDQTLTLAALSVFASGDTHISGISHIRGQESDRMLVIKNELEKLGVVVELSEDSITIRPRKLKKATVEIDTYNDHRVAMAFSLIGLRHPEIIIQNPDCSKKTFADYFKILDKITDNNGYFVTEDY